MAGNFAAYQQLQPAVPDFSKALDILMTSDQQAKAQRDARAAAQHKKYDALQKELAEYTVELDDAKVQYHFRDEMMRVGAEVQDELYKIGQEKIILKANGQTMGKKYRELSLREMELKETPKNMEGVFNTFNTALTDLEKGIKDGKYDDKLNTELLSELTYMMKDNSWTFKDGKYHITTRNGEKKELSPGQMESNPLIFGTPQAFVDVPQFSKDLMDRIGTERITYTNDDGEEVVIQRSKVDSSPAEAEKLRNFLISQIEARDDVVNKIGINNEDSVHEAGGLADDIMKAAGFKASVIRSVTPPKKTGSRSGSGTDFWEANPAGVGTTIGTFYYGDGNSNTYTNNVEDEVNFNISAKSNVIPSSIFITQSSEPNVIYSGETDKLKKVDEKDGETKTTIEAKSNVSIPTRQLVSESNVVVKDFSLRRMNKRNLYNGDAEYRIVYNNEDGKEVEAPIKKGSELPTYIIDNPSSITRIQPLAIESQGIMGKLFGSDSQDLPTGAFPGLIESIQQQSDEILMAEGIGYLSGVELEMAIPVNETNSTAIADINASSQRDPRFKKQGAVDGYIQRYGQGYSYRPQTNKDVANEAKEVIKTTPTETTTDTDTEVKTVNIPLTTSDDKYTEAELKEYGFPDEIIQELVNSGADKAYVDKVYGE